MFLILGATSYIGQAFATELRRRGDRFIPLSRSAFDYSRFELLFEYVRNIKPEFIINAAGSSAVSCSNRAEFMQEQVFQINTVLPQTIARVCDLTQTPWGHVSSAMIYSGAKFLENGVLRIQRDLNQVRWLRQFEIQPERFFGFTETDEPNCSFHAPPCSFWQGTKALAEEALRGRSQMFIWRAGLTFNEQDVPSNLLFQLHHRPSAQETVACLSQVDDFVRACLDLVERHAPFGIYNVTNPGAVTTRQMAAMIQRILKPGPVIELFDPESPGRNRLGQIGASGCILDVTKLSFAGLKLHPVSEALEAALEQWQPVSCNKRQSVAGHLRAPLVMR